jgi:Ricin-type beta-trefoil lectin domain
VSKTRRLLAIAAAALFCLAMLAATGLTAPGAKAATYHELYWGQGGTLCLAETGTQTGVYLSDCNTTNHSLYWAIPAEGGTGQIINEHSGLCLTANDAGGVYLATCGTNHVQLWTRIRFDGMWDKYANAHVPGYLYYFITNKGVAGFYVGTSPDYGGDFWNS